MFVTNRTTVLLVLGSVLNSIVDATTLEVPVRTDVANSQITTPPSLPSPDTVEKRATSAVTCSEWIVLNNGTPAQVFVNKKCIGS